jgi:hypothetical protein
MNYLETDAMLHRAAQYLSSFGTQYLEKRDDDSQSNMLWNTDEGALYSRKTDDGQYLTLHLANLSLTWNKESVKHSLELEGRSHGEVCVWLHHIALRFGMEEYDFYLNYTIETGKLRPEQVFNDFDTTRATELIAMRNLAQEVCEKTKEHFDLKTEIRIWPHHFDTGGFAALPGSSIDIGFGIAIPDAIEGDYYLYASGYKDGKPMNTESFPQLEEGQWHHREFNGATLPLADNTVDDCLEFIKKAIATLSQQVSD